MSNWIYNPFLDLSHFMCNGNVRYLDLSYNDITHVGVRGGQFNTKLQNLNLVHNIIVGFEIISGVMAHDVDKVWAALVMFSSLRELNLSATWRSGNYEEGLWRDSPNGLANEEHTQPSNTTDMGLGLRFGIPLAYDIWFEDLLKNCGRHNDILKCYLYSKEDICIFLQCLVPDFNTDDCSIDDIGDQALYFTSKVCSTYSQCVYGVHFPLPPDLRLMQLNDVLHNIRIDFPLQNITTICFHPHNNLESIDMSRTNLNFLTDIPGIVHFTGFENLKYVNLHGCKLQLQRYKLLFSDNGSRVRELHIGGNIVGPGDILPTEYLQTHTKLSVLNVTDANIQGVEHDAFLNLKELKVLDLSHNRLNASALETMDLSHTKLQSLNLSDNHLTVIPASFRRHLEKMPHLDVYLAGNAFICSCDNLAFLEWVQNSGSNSITFHYAGDHVCADSPGNTIHNIDVDSLHCNWYWVQPVIAVGSSLALTALLLAFVGVYKKRWTIRNLIFRLQERLTSPSQDTGTTAYKYDAFVLYSSIPDDRLWVHLKLVQELENVYGFRLCVHHRDFLGGCDIVDNIEQAILSSRKVLVVMSENFIGSDWCVDEVRMTMSVDRNKFVVIMYRDVMLSAAPMPAVVRRLLESRTYIEWDERPEGEQLFWKKLRRALYSKRNGSTARQEESHT
jgi:uncharacterized protein YjbI with pentapeptide repeats